MRFSIRDLFLITSLVAISLGWWIDHRAAVARERNWEQAFQKALETLSFHVQRESVTVESPNGPWTIHCTFGAAPERNE